MNSPKYVSDTSRTKEFPAVYAFSFASAIALCLSSCGEKKGPEAHSISASEKAQSNFCVDLKSEHFDAGVRQKIRELGTEIPEILTLFTGLEALPNCSLQFFDKNGFLKYLQQQNVPTNIAEAYIQNAGAMTFIPDKKSSKDEENITIYLGPHALENKDNFIEGVVNEILNAYMALQIPSELESKQRFPDTSGGLNISDKEMRGIGIEFTKEYISGLFSTLIREKYQKKNISCTLQQLRENLRIGIFWHTDTPNYAFEYFYDILRNHGFPVEKNEELLKLYTFCIETYWSNISHNLLRMSQSLNIPITK